MGDSVNVWGVSALSQSEVNRGEKGEEIARMGRGEPKADTRGNPKGCQEVVRYFSLETATEERTKAMNEEIDIGKFVNHIQNTPTVVYYATGSTGTTSIPLRDLYAMFVATRRGMASVRFRDTSHHSMVLFVDINYLDHRKTFGELYNEEDFR